MSLTAAVSALSAAPRRGRFAGYNFLLAPLLLAGASQPNLGRPRCVFVDRSRAPQVRKLLEGGRR
eukprot:8628437-Pyramimonas_sp.AAC.1